MADSLEKLKKDLADIQKKHEEWGWTGEEYEAHMAAKPRPPLPLAFRCYYELQPIYEFLIDYAQRCSEVGEVIPFDVELLTPYEQYVDIIYAASENDSGELLDPDYARSRLNFEHVRFLCLLRIARELAKKETTFLTGIGGLVTWLKYDYESYPLTGVDKSRVYNGKHFDELVKRYVERLEAHDAEAKRIAEENVKRRMNDGGS